MAEEAVAEAGALMGALDQAGNVGEHELGLVAAHHAELGMQGGEGIVGDLRPRRRGRRQQGRFAGIGQTHQPGIGDQLQPQPQPAFLARTAGIGAARRAVGRGLELRIAAAADAALRQQDALARPGEVGDHGFLVLVQHLRAHRQLDDQVLAAGAAAVLAHAVMAAFGLEMLLVAEIDQRVQIVHRLGIDIAAAAAMAAVRAAELDELLAPEADRAGAAIAAADIDLGLVEELHGG